MEEAAQSWALDDREDLERWGRGEARGENRTGPGWWLMI